MSILNERGTIAIKKSRFNDEQITFALRQAEAGVQVQEVCRQLGVSEATFYNWKAMFGGMGVTELRHLRLLEQENDHLKKLVADLSLDRQMLQDDIKKSCKASRQERASQIYDGGIPGIDQEGLRGIAEASVCDVLQAAQAGRNIAHAAYAENRIHPHTIWI